MSQPPQFPQYSDRPQDVPAWVPPSASHPVESTQHPQQYAATGHQPTYQQTYQQPYPGTYQYPPAYGYGYPTAPGTNGLAIAALVTGLLGFGPVPVGLGIGALRSIRRTRESGSGMAIAGIVLGALGTLAIVGFVLLLVFAEPDDSFASDGPAGTQSGESADIGTLQIGDCFDDDADDYEVVIRSCTEGHDAEVFSSLVLPDRPFPGDRAVRDEAQASCDRDFRSYVGIDAHASKLETDLLYPDRSMWEDGYRDVLCFAYGPDGDQLHATVKDSKR